MPYGGNGETTKISEECIKEDKNYGLYLLAVVLVLDPDLGAVPVGLPVGHALVVPNVVAHLKAK